MEGVNLTPAEHGGRCWRGFEEGRWQRAIDVRDFILRNVTPYDGDETFLVGPTRRAPRRSGRSCSPISRRSDEGRAGRRRGDAVHPARPRAGLDRPRQRGHRRPADRHAVPPRDLSGRRPAHGRSRPEGRRVRGRSRGARGLHQVSQDPQRRRLRRLYAGDHALPASPASSPACPMPMAAAASSATTGASRCTASTGCSPPSARSARSSTTCGRPTR